MCKLLLANTLKEEIGEFNYNISSKESEQLKGLRSIDLCKLGDRDPQKNLNSPYSDTNLSVLNRLTDFEIADIYINTNNKCHNLSAIFSAVNFKKKGKPENKKIILNFDRHEDNGYKVSDIVSFENWGKCVLSNTYKEYVEAKKEVRYIVIGTKRPLSENFDIIIKEIPENEVVDLYITIDRDVYKGSYTCYGDGLYECNEIYDYIANLIQKNKDKINLCGMDITGAPNPINGQPKSTEPITLEGIDIDILKCKEIYKWYRD